MSTFSMSTNEGRRVRAERPSQSRVRNWSFNFLSLPNTEAWVNAHQQIMRAQRTRKSLSTKNETLRGGITAATAGIVKLALRLGYYQHVIAAYFRDNQGRVSEIKRGRRYAEVPPVDQLPPDFPAMA